VPQSLELKNIRCAYRIHLRVHVVFRKKKDHVPM